MNIAFLNSIEKQTYGGMEEWIRLVAAGLSARGHNVFLLGRADSRYLQRAGKSVPRENICELSIAGDFDPRTIIDIKNILDRRSIDVLCVNFNKDIRLGGIAARWQKRAKVIWSVGINIAKDKFSHRHLTPRLIDGVITPSKSLKNQIAELGYIDPETVHVIPNGTRLRNSSLIVGQAREKLRDKYRLPAESVIAVNSGRFVNHKGHAFLIEAAPAIIAKHPRLVFLFLGDGYLQAKHQHRISALGLDKHFVFAGMLDDLQLELMGSDLMVHPSIIEPFGISLIEGMQAGLPIVASSVGGIPEVVGNCDCAILVDPGDVEQLARAVISILDSPERMRQMGLAAQAKWREEFTVDIMLNRVEQYLTRFVDSGAK